MSHADAGLQGGAIGAGATRLGRLADTRPGRTARDRLAVHGLLWPLVAARQRPRRTGGREPTPDERVLAALGFPGNIGERLVTRRTDVCIEGFPRSANTYTVLAFRQWNPGLRVAHHMHAVFQVRRAVKLGVPCCVLVREPLDAVASTVLMDRERVSDDACFESYVRFHRGLEPLRNGVVVCDFEELVADPSVAVERLNERFGTAFASVPMTRADEASTLAEVRRRRRPAAGLPDYLTPAPSPEKERRKAELRERLARHPARAAAESAYAALLPDRAAPR
ncbi:MAG: hypothetical protein ACR2IN_04710 [Thermoleophilaceae bacterium]